MNLSQIVGVVHFHRHKFSQIEKTLVYYSIILLYDTFVNFKPL